MGTAIGRFDHVDVRLLALAVVCQLLGSVCHARAWGNLLQAARPDSRFPRGAVLCAHLAGVAGNAVVPAHAGDAAKIVLIRRAAPGTPVATIVTTLVMLTAVDVVLGGGALIATASTSLGPAVPRPSAAGMLIPAALLVAAVIAAVVGRRRLRGVRRPHARRRCAALQPASLPARSGQLAGRRLAGPRRGRLHRPARLRAAGIVARRSARRGRDGPCRRDPLPARRRRGPAGDARLRATRDRLGGERRHLRRRHAVRRHARST